MNFEEEKSFEVEGNGEIYPDESSASEDWYNESDTSSDIPDPNMSTASLYQERDKLPVNLQKCHFAEGYIYTMTLKQKKQSMLVMIVELCATKFLYRIFFIQNSSAKTWHQGAEDRWETYNSVWRLAPRQELFRAEESGNIRAEQTIRFFYDVEESQTTGLVLRQTSSCMTCRIECGVNRGNTKVFETNLIVNCEELFTASTLQNLLLQAREGVWENSPKSVSPKLPEYRPRLKFIAPSEERYKRR